MRIIAAFIFLFSLQCLAANVTLTGVGQVEFEAAGRPSMLKIKGAGEGVNSSLQVNGKMISGEITFKLKTLKTGMELRDEHMLDKYLQATQYPEARLIFKDFQMPGFWSLQNPLIATSSFRAKLQLHGVEREITGQYAIENKEFKTRASFDVKLSDYKIAAPVYLGVKVADVVHVTVTINKMAPSK